MSRSQGFAGSKNVLQKFILVFLRLSPAPYTQMSSLLRLRMSRWRRLNVASEKTCRVVVDVSGFEDQYSCRNLYEQLTVAPVAVMRAPVKNVIQYPTDIPCQRADNAYVARVLTLKLIWVGIKNAAANKKAHTFWVFGHMQYDEASHQSGCSNRPKFL